MKDSPADEAARLWAGVKAAVLTEHAHLFEDLRLWIQVGEWAAFGTDLGRQYQLQLAGLFTPRPRTGRNTADRELLRFSVSPEAAFREQQSLTAIERVAEARYAQAYRTWVDGLRARALPGADFRPSVLSPVAPARAFRAALETLDLPSAGRLSLYEGFEGCVIGGLGRIYTVAMTALQSGSIGSLPAKAYSTAAVLAVDPEWKQSMFAIRDDTGIAFERDRRLAGDLLAILARHAEGALHQRLGLCGLLLKPVLVANPRRPASMFLRLRWSLLKIALADETIFERPSHPLRLALRDLAAGSGPAEIGRRLQQLEISADFIAPLLQRLADIPGHVVDRLGEQLQAQDQSLHDHRLAAARRVVASTMDRCSLGMPRPTGLRLFLRAGWGPLLTQCYLLKGGESQEWQTSVRQLEHLLTLLGEPSTRVRDFEPQVMMAGASLFAVGVHADRVERLQQALREAYDELHVGAPDAVTTLRPSAGESFRPGDGYIEFDSPARLGVTSVQAEPMPVKPLPAVSRTLDPPDLELIPV